MDPFVLSRNAFNTYCLEHINNHASNVILKNTNTNSNNNNNNNNPSTINISQSSIYASDKLNYNREYYERTIRTLNQRYEYFLQTLEQLQISFGQLVSAISHKNHNINSISNSKREIYLPSFVTNKQNNKKHLHRSIKRRMPKVYVTVSCGEHLTQQKTSNATMN